MLTHLAYLMDGGSVIHNLSEGTKDEVKGAHNQWSKPIFLTSFVKKHLFIVAIFIHPSILSFLKNHLFIIALFMIVRLPSIPWSNIQLVGLLITMTFSSCHILLNSIQG